MKVILLAVNIWYEIFIDFKFNSIESHFVKLKKLNIIRKRYYSRSSIHFILLSLNEFKLLTRNIRIKIAEAGMSVLIIEQNIDTRGIIYGFQYGAAGFLIEPFSVQEFYLAIQTIVDGNIAMSPVVSKQLVESFKIDINQDNQITQREHDILQELSLGRTYSSIGSSLNISIDTVRTHLKHIYDKLQVNSKEKALEKARSVNLI